MNSSTAHVWQHLHISMTTRIAVCLTSISLSCTLLLLLVSSLSLHLSKVGEIVATLMNMSVLRICAIHRYTLSCLSPVGYVQRTMEMTCHLNTIYHIVTTSSLLFLRLATHDVQRNGVCIVPDDKNYALHKTPGAHRPGEHTGCA